MGDTVVVAEEVEPAILLNVLAECDREGLFGNRKENGLLLFAFYIDDYDGNEEDSLLYRSTELLNPKKDWDKLKG